MPHPASSPSASGTTSISADEIAAHIRQLPRNVFIRAADLPGAASDGTRALTAATAAGEIMRVRHGLYWNGDAPPSPLGTLRALHGDHGFGPTGLSAADALGIAAATPNGITVGMAGPPRTPFPGITFAHRPATSRAELRWLEYAILEALDDPDTLVAGGWTALTDRVRTLSEDGGVRIDLIVTAARRERSRARRGRVEDLARTLTPPPDRL